MKLSIEGASCYLQDDGDSIRLFSLYTKPEQRCKGYATRLVRECIDFSNEKNKPLRLRASPFADKPVPVDKLVSFYSSLGFVNDPGYGEYVLTYNPKQENPNHVHRNTNQTAGTGVV